MNPRVKEAILWGVVGMLTFLVLLQGYELLEDIRVDLTVKVGGTIVVGVVTTVATYLASGRMAGPEKGSQPVAAENGETDDYTDDDQTVDDRADDDHTNDDRADR